MKSYMSVDSEGNIHYKNSLGRYHRTDGPAYITKEGFEFWYKDGMLHREDGPAVTDILNNKLHYALNDIEYLKEEWESIIIKLKLNRIKDL